MIVIFFSLTKQDSKEIEKIDLYAQMNTIVFTLLKQELPELNTRHHLLYTANVKLETYRTASQYHRQRANVQTAIGTYHKKASEENLKRFNQLQILIEAYIQLSIIEERHLLNHRLRMKDLTINSTYEELQAKQDITLSAAQEETFWNALKEDILPVISLLEA